MNLPAMSKVNDWTRDHWRDFYVRECGLSRAAAEQRIDQREGGAGRSAAASEIVLPTPPARGEFKVNESWGGAAVEPHSATDDALWRLRNEVASLRSQLSAKGMSAGGSKNVVLFGEAGETNERDATIIKLAESFKRVYTRDSRFSDDEREVVCFRAASK